MSEELVDLVVASVVLRLSHSWASEVGRRVEGLGLRVSGLRFRSLGLRV